MQKVKGPRGNREFVFLPFPSTYSREELLLPPNISSPILTQN